MFTQFSIQAGRMFADQPQQKFCLWSERGKTGPNQPDYLDVCGRLAANSGKTLTVITHHLMERVIVRKPIWSYLVQFSFLSFLSLIPCVDIGLPLYVVGGRWRKRETVNLRCVRYSHVFLCLWRESNLVYNGIWPTGRPYSSERWQQMRRRWKEVEGRRKERK